jgi:hypothetical protein
VTDAFGSSSRACQMCDMASLTCSKHKDKAGRGVRARGCMGTGQHHHSTTNAQQIQSHSLTQTTGPTLPCAPPCLPCARRSLPPPYTCPSLPPPHTCP